MALTKKKGTKATPKLPDINALKQVNSNDAVFLLYHVMFGKEDYPLYVPCAHALQHVAAKAMTCTVDGNIEYCRNW